MTKTETADEGTVYLHATADPKTGVAVGVDTEAVTPEHLGFPGQPGAAPEVSEDDLAVDPTATEDKAERIGRDDYERAMESGRQQYASQRREDNAFQAAAAEAARIADEEAKPKARTPRKAAAKKSPRRR